MVRRAWAEERRGGGSPTWVRRLRAACGPRYGPRAVASERLLSALEAGFGLRPVVERDLGGAYNLNLLVRSRSGRQVVRVHRPWVSLERVMALQQTRERLAAAGLPVARPLAAPLRFEGRVVEVEEFIAHDRVVDAWSRAESAFALLGRLHDALRRLTPSPLLLPAVSHAGGPFYVLAWLGRMERALLHAPDDQEVRMGRAACRETRRLLGRFAAWWRQHVAWLPRQPIHGDFGWADVVFREGAVAAVLDFDFLARRERAFELARSLWTLLRRLAPGVPPARYPWGRLRRLLAAYDASTERPLQSVELAALPYELARMPLTWVAEAALIGDALGTLRRAVVELRASRWLLDHTSTVVAELLPAG
ncbi:MAG TPA: hypothetical protein VFD01_13570 [Candidatus Dormibacteraeota bacterium]|nr:hypothetical protein [Candidatus Dormibacteraeota bacterium]